MLCLLFSLALSTYLQQKILLTGFSRYLLSNKKHILQTKNHLMARMFWFHKEAMDLYLE